MSTDPRRGGRFLAPVLPFPNQDPTGAGMRKTADHKAKEPTLKTPRLSVGSLRGLSKQQLATLKAELDSRWMKDNRPSGRSRGRPNAQAQVFAACDRIKRGMLHRDTKVTLTDWYRAVEEDLRTRGIHLSIPTKSKYIREWMETHLSLDESPDGLGPYLINKQNDFREVRWILLWGALCENFSAVRTWLKAYQRQYGVCPGELPHEILPAPLQDTIKLRFDAPLGPRLYDLLLRESLRNAPDK